MYRLAHSLSKSGRTVEVTMIMEDEPHNSSLAAYLLLKELYLVQDETRRQEKYDYLEWLAFRKRFLKKFRRKHGSIFCQYCGKDHLVIEATNRHPLVATIDHITPISKGGSVYDPKNLAVACRKCNSRKGANENIYPTIFESPSKIKFKWQILKRLISWIRRNFMKQCKHTDMLRLHHNVKLLKLLKTSNN